MDLGDGSVRSRSEEEETVGKDTHLNEIGRGMNGPSDASGIGDLPFTAESTESGTLGRSADDGKSPGINGSCVDSISKIVSPVEANGEIVTIEEAVAATLSKGIGSPSEISKGSEGLAPQSKSKEVDKVENLEKVVQLDETKLDSNMSGVDEIRKWDGNLHLNGKGIESEKTLQTPSKTIGSPPADSGLSPQTKGYGLKRWRRIRRDHTKDGAGMVDPNRVLKRGLPNAEPVKAQVLSLENRLKSEASGSGSVNSTFKDVGFSAMPIGVSDSESRLAMGNAFAIGVGADSENSEDRSSKSTAASTPKLRPEVPAVSKFTKEKSKVKNTKGSGNAAHRAQQGKGKVETTKKFRGERVEIEKENSHSSVESAVFTFGRQREGSSNYDGENSDEVQLCELQYSEEARADYCKENGEDAEVMSRKDVTGYSSGMEKNPKGENQGLNAEQDPFAESIILLQNAQEVLEKEIQKLEEIGKEPVSLPDSSSCGVSSSTQGLPEEIQESSSAPKEANLTQLSQRVSLLEHELELATAALKAKESEILELESILNTTRSVKRTNKDNLGSHVETSKDVEMELDGLFRSKIEAAVEYLLMQRHTCELKIVAEGGTSLPKQLKTLVKNKEQMPVKLKDAEDKATILEREGEKLETSSKELLGAEDVLEMQNNVCKFTLCSLAQLILLCIAFAFVLLQLLPHSNGVVPT